MNRHELGQIRFAEFINVVQFAVREQPGTSDAAENIAGLAFDAFVIGLDRAIAFLGRFAFIDEQNLFVGMFTQIVSRK